MKALNRLLKYVWPQWPRVIVVVVSAVMIAVLLSATFMTLIPLLKVFLGEGLHGWVDGKSCQSRYGIDFYSPEITDLTGTEAERYAHSLLVQKVEPDSPAARLSITVGDWILSIGDTPPDQLQQQQTSSELLAALATRTDPEIIVWIDRQEETSPKRITLPTNAEFYADADDAPFKTIKYGIEKAAIVKAQWAVSFLSRQQDSHTKFKAILYIIFLVGLLTIVRCIAKFYQGYLGQKVVQIGVNHLREDVFAHIMNMPLAYFANERPSDAVSRIVRDTSVMGNAIKVMLGKALREPLNALFLILGALWINWQLTLIFMGGAPFVLVVVGGFGKKMKRATKKSLMAGSLMLSKLNETMAGLRVVKVYNQQDNERNRFKQINNRLLKQLLKISKVDAATSPVLEVLGMTAGCLALAFGAKWVTQTKIDSTEFLALLALLGISAESIRKASGIWNKIQEANAAADRVFGIMDEPLEFEKPNAIEMPPLKNKVEFRNVIFSYPLSDRPVLNRVNLTVEAGQTIALVGPNGSGKTTLVNLLPRFYDVDAGSILIDGTDVRDCTLKSLRSQIGMVTQNVVTFNDTVASNIAYGKPDASRNQIIEAASRAFADEFITLMPDGYDTVIGEQGAGLSGGQLQRIVIARAILKNPAILIFDEATSQVDADSEAKIHKAVEEIMKERTSFIIAHRFSTIINADLIVVMDDGRIIDQGQHEQLIKSCPLYQSLYETQLVKG